MNRAKKINVNNIDVRIVKIDGEDFVCLTDMAKGKDGDDNIKNWMRNRNTLEFLGLWEIANNAENFKGVEFDTFRNEAGLNSFTMTPKKWIEATNASGIMSRAGKNGGTYAHKDIAFEFGSWLSPSFKFYLIKEYQRLKRIEENQYNSEWNVGRILSSINYRTHTDAIMNHAVANPSCAQNKARFLYMKEADLLNICVFGYTSKEWKDANPQLVLEGNKNPRDVASINQLVVMSNIEVLNADMLKQGKTREERFEYLYQEAREMLKRLDKNEDFMKSIERKNETTYVELEETNKTKP